MNREDRVKGALIGIAVGDAMGMPTEFFSRAAIKARFGRIETFLPAPADGLIPRDLVAGETTDDTANSQLVIAMLEETGGRADPAVFIRLLKHWIDTSPKSSAVTGPSTARAIKAIEDGTPMEEAGKMGTTNGGAMKIAPLGLANRPDDLPALVEQVRLLCLPTHNTGTAIAGAAAIAAAVSAAAEGWDDWDKIWALAGEAAALGAAQGFDAAAPRMTARMALARRLVDEAADEVAACDAIYDIVGSGLPTAESVPAALALAYLSAGDPMRCARLCAEIGADTDTVGAMACAIVGAMAGQGAFPADAVELVSRVNSLDFGAMARVLV